MGKPPLKFILLNLLLLALSFLSGCTNRVYYQYPELKNSVTISVSSETVSMLTETPAEDALVPNSQVFVGGNGYFKDHLGLMPLVGALAAVEIDRALNRLKFNNVESALQVNFKAELSQILNSSELKLSSHIKYGVHDNPQIADIVLLPSARFVIDQDSRAAIHYRVTARCKNLNSAGSGEKTYVYTPNEVHAFSDGEGWVDNDSAIFKKVTTRALNAIAHILIKDMSGAYNSKLAQEKRQAVKSRVKTGSTDYFTSILLEENPEYMVLTPMPDNKPRTSLIDIVEPSVLLFER